MGDLERVMGRNRKEVEGRVEMRRKERRECASRGEVLEEEGWRREMRETQSARHMSSVSLSLS